MLNMVNEFHDDTDFMIEGYLPEITVEKIESQENKDSGIQVFKSNSSNKRTLLVIGDSFSNAMTSYLPQLYQTAVFSTFKSYTPELFSQYDVDDVVYLNAERNQRYFEQISTVLEGEFKGPF